MKDSAFGTGFLALTFVLIWSTGPIFTKLGLQYTTPFVFLSVRLIAASLILIPLCFLMKAPWPSDWQSLKHVLVSGFLMQGVYLGSSFLAMSLATPPALFSIILGMQPILTAVLCFCLFNDRVTHKQWLGLGLGLIGLFIATAHGFSAHQLNGLSFLFLIIALLGITVGTIYQKRQCHHVDYRTSCALQNAVGVGINLLLALCLEPLKIHWTWQFSLAIFWMVVPVSICAFIILIILIKHGDVTKVSSLFYIVPPSTAVMAYFAFGDKITLPTVMSLIIISVGIFLVNHTGKKVVA